MIKILDRMANELKQGATYHFRPLDAPITLKEIVAPGVIDTEAPGRIVLEVTIPFKPDKPGQAIVFQDLMQVYHPAEAMKVEQQISDILDGKVPPLHRLQLAPEAPMEEVPDPIRPTFKKQKRRG